jgi:hypothetical protein
MMRRRQNPLAKWSSTAVCCAGLVMLAALPASGAEAVPFLSHRAVYDLSLEADPSRAMIETAQGRIVFEFSGSKCEGYTQNFRQVVDLQGDEFGRRLVDSRALTFEEGDGSGMRYSSTVIVNDGEPEEIKGEVKQENGQIRVKLAEPSPETLTITGKSVFPTSHYLDLIAAAGRGDATHEARVFDGTGDGKTVSDTFAIIGKQLPATDAGEVIRKAGFASVKRWPVTISYFDGDGQERETPSYMISMELYENGVADSLRLDYVDFVLKGTLRQMEAIPQRACP